MDHILTGRGTTPLGIMLAGLLSRKEEKKQMQVNQEKSGAVRGVGAGKLLVVVDGADRSDVDSLEARDMAREAAAAAGFGAGGMCEQPVIGPIGPDGNMLEGEDALNPNIEVQGFRTEFMFAQRL